MGQELLRPPIAFNISYSILLVGAWCILTAAWDPPFPFRAGDVPEWDLLSRVDFQMPNLMSVDEEPIRYQAGQKLAEAGKPLRQEQIQILWAEHLAVLQGRGVGVKLLRFAAVFVLLLVLVGLAGVYIFVRRPDLALESERLLLLLATALGAAALARWVAPDPWRGEIIPLLLFSQSVAIALRRELAILLGSIVALAIVLALGQSLPHLLVLLGVMATAVVQLGRVRTRSKLIQVSCVAAVAAFGLSLAGDLLRQASIDWFAVRLAIQNALWTIAAGFLMWGLLQPIERLFGVLTDISLLELADMSQPLLQELLRRAPGTYNHSILVGAMAEAAAEAIGARGLLARVGAYYHDIGKILQPEFYVENQSGENRHENLRPAMSTLLIMSHVKDGADLARQYKLPQPIIDFIEQHHGTTLVRYFFDRASEQWRASPDLPAVEESTFRYRGPKPRTKEAAVLMLADSVEGACRALEDPSPSRIEHLVRQIARAKLEDGQFDESGITLRELRTVENSLIKSLVANYHGRIRYPATESVSSR